MLTQVEKFSETVQPRAENVSEQFGLQEMFWSPLLLRGFSTCHFLLSVVLIAAYWHLKVCLYNSSSKIHKSPFLVMSLRQLS